MQLYVRTQNKMALVNCKIILVEEFRQQFRVYSNDYGTLGKYETEERCLEILDEIQKLITNGNKTVLTTSSDLDKDIYNDILEEVEKNNFTILSYVNTPLVFPLNQNIVYQMPEK